MQIVHDGLSSAQAQYTQVTWEETAKKHVILVITQVSVHNFNLFYMFAIINQLNHNDITKILHKYITYINIWHIYHINITMARINDHAEII